ncbi:transposase domain-containing protein, partial [Catenibacterium mitsuokai]|uniref:transposase domain-containing protein n=1 Tax=Catenibacterium mitsuokai TaxID=100886 RepID=UPI00319E8683
DSLDFSSVTYGLILPYGVALPLRNIQADASASIFSLIETAKANRLSPFDYIEYILEIMPWIDIIQLPEKIDWFMPWSD